MKKILILLLLFSSLTAINKQQIYKKLSLDNVWEVKSIIQKDEAIIILPFKTDTNQRFKNQLTQALTPYYDVLEIESLPQIKKLLKLGKQDWFDERKAAQMGKMIPAKWAITGKIKVISKKVLFKKQFTLQSDLKIYNLRLGNLKHSIRLQVTEKSNIPKYWYSIVITILFLLSLLINRILKNYYSGIIFIIWLIISLLYSIWFWLI